MGTLRYTLTRGELEIDLSIEYSMEPIIGATWFDPPEGGEVEIIGIYDTNGLGLKFEVTDAEYEAIDTFVNENGEPGDPYDYYD